MASHNEKGKDGESVACAFLIKNGFEIHFCNWRQGHYELDIIATKGETVHFVEVKTRYSLQFGYPEEAVSRKKFNNLKKAAAAFLVEYPGYKRIQFDIVSILKIKHKPTEFFFIEDVYI